MTSRTWARAAAAAALAVAVLLAVVAGRDRGLLSALAPEPTGDSGLDALAIFAPTAAPLRLAVAGTSLTASSGWPERVAAALERCRGAPVAVQRLARNGATSRWGARRLAAALSLAPPPDLLIAEFSINDADLRIGMTLRDSAARIESILATAAAHDVPVILATMNPAFGAAARRRPGQAAYRALYRDRVHRGRVALLDTVADWRALDRAARRAALPDGLHPTEAALAAVFEPRLRAALATRLCPPDRRGRTGTGARGVAADGDMAVANPARRPQKTAGVLNSAPVDRP